ncbi:hypothetical protein Vretimale_11180 [Volvox reticuliferus]|uniref:Uncharacterized protein n=1 Tax=Volvox reticuliferus TaxID=1737510 RepID=A0A8J4FPD3_9CHLO|nr:hypothetical protein Vretifemale_12032 [Volvox reticuliferus]GIM06949.1 hypothetical protein Vretimale_11180 [Volvox reticuliferus]
MPKVRERSRITQDFAVTPWQNRREGSKGDSPDALYVVEEAPLLVSTVTTSRAPTVHCGVTVIAAPHEDVDTTGWFTKAPRRHTTDAPAPTIDSEMTAIPPLSVPVDSSIGDWDNVSVPALDDNDKGGPAWTGFCQLAITPAGRGMGHVFLPGFVNREVGRGPVSRGARCYGLALRPVPRGVPADPCTEDESTDLLCARLTDFTSGAVMDVLVARTGGDMCRLAPPEDWLLRQWFGDDFETDKEDDGRAGLDASREPGGKWEEATDGEEDDREGDLNQGEGEGREGNTGEAEELDATVGCDLAEGLPSTHAVVEPYNTADWMRLWRRQVRFALEFHFEPETLLSGVAALPKLTEFARPLLPPHLAGISQGGGQGGGGGGGGADSPGASFTTDGFNATGIDRALRSSLQRMHLIYGAGTREQGEVEMQTSAGLQAGELIETEVEAVVCLGPATIRGVLWTFPKGLD